MTGPFVGELAGISITSAIQSAPVFASNISYYSKYAVLKTYSSYTAVTSSDLYFMSLGYASKVMGLMPLQYTGGLVTGFILEPDNIFTQDFSTGTPWIDIGIQSGSILRWYVRKFLERTINEKEINN